MNVFFIVLGVGMMAVGAVLLVLGLIFKRKPPAKPDPVASWPQAPAQIMGAYVQPVAAQPGGPRTAWEPSVHVRFQVNGRDYEGHRIRLEPMRMSTPRLAESSLTKYSVGSWTQVRYNPMQPEENCLELRLKPPLSFMASAGLFLLVFGFFSIGTGIAGALGLYRHRYGHY